jgi:hypothetical protein
VDASGSKGWGFNCVGAPKNLTHPWSQGRWTAEQILLHNNMLEVLAAEYSIFAFIRANSLSNCHIAVGIDNTTALSYFLKQAGKYWKFLKSVLLVSEFVNPLHITLSFFYVTSKENLADLPSRIFKDSSDWKLSPRIFQAIANHFGMPDVDAFATFENKQIDNFVSRFPQPHCLYVDIFRPDKQWRNFDIMYANPPFQVFEKILDRLTWDSPGLLLLIVPFWPSQPYFNRFFDFLVAFPLLLPRHADLFSKPKAPFSPVCEHRPNWQTICLPLSGISWNVEKFQETLTASSRSAVQTALLAEKGVNGELGQNTPQRVGFAYSISILLKALVSSSS